MRAPTAQRKQRPKKKILRSTGLGQSYKCPELDNLKQAFKKALVDHKQADMNYDVKNIIENNDDNPNGLDIREVIDEYSSN